MTAKATFHLFPGLPKELRLLIWEEAVRQCGQPRTVNVRPRYVPDPGHPTADTVHWCLINDNDRATLRRYDPFVRAAKLEQVNLESRDTARAIVPKHLGKRQEAFYFESISLYGLHLRPEEDVFCYPEMRIVPRDSWLDWGNNDNTARRDMMPFKKWMMSYDRVLEDLEQLSWFWPESPLRLFPDMHPLLPWDHPGWLEFILHPGRDIIVRCDSPGAPARGIFKVIPESEFAQAEVPGMTTEDKAYFLGLWNMNKNAYDPLLGDFQEIPSLSFAFYSRAD